MGPFMVIVLAIIILLAVLMYLERPPPNFPPGPSWYLPPIIGSLPFLGYPPHKRITSLGKTFGNIYSARAGNIHAVILNNWPAVKAVFVDQGDNFIGRPQVTVAKEIMKGNDIATTGGPIWKERKRFCLSNFKNYGFGKAPMEAFVMEESEKLIEYIKANGTKKLDVTYLFFFPLLNIIWRFVGGKRFEMEDKRMTQFIKNIITLFENGNANNVFIFLPLLRYFPVLRGTYKGLADAHRKVSLFIEEEVDDHIKTFQEIHHRDLIDAFIAEMKKAEKAKDKSGKYKKDVIIGLAYDFFNAAVDAGNHTLAWGLLYMATWQEIQGKIHEELDRVVGRDRLPTYVDRNRLPYTKAVLLEIFRYSSVAPLSVPHTSLAPCKVMGYDLPKDTFVVENIYACHNDPEYWGDPEVFRPERFFDEKGEVHRPEYLIPFGTGARMCMGEPLGKVEMFIIFTGILHQFTAKYVTGEKPPTFNEVVGLNSRPEDFGLSFVPR